MQALAEASRLSAPFLSQLERGLTTPSVVSLMGIAQALGVDANYFISVPDQTHMVRRRAAPDVVEVAAKVAHHRLSGDHEERKMEALLMIIPAGRRSPASRRESEGFYYVVEGELEMTVGSEAFVLREGDSAHFDERHPHTLANTGERPVHVLRVGTPA